MAPAIGDPVGFVLGVVVGGLALFLAGELVHGDTGFEYGLVTAVLGAVVWGLLSWVPLVGWLLAPLGWVGVIKWRFPGSWRHAITVAVVAWAVAIVALAVLGSLGLGGLDVVGVPLA